MKNNSIRFFKKIKLQQSATQFGPFDAATKSATNCAGGWPDLLLADRNRIKWRHNERRFGGLWPLKRNLTADFIRNSTKMTVGVVENRMASHLSAPPMELFELNCFNLIDVSVTCDALIDWLVTKINILSSHSSLFGVVSSISSGPKR